MAFSPFCFQGSYHLLLPIDRYEFCAAIVQFNSADNFNFFSARDLAANDPLRPTESVHPLGVNVIWIINHRLHVWPEQSSLLHPLVKMD